MRREAVVLVGLVLLALLAFASRPGHATAAVTKSTFRVPVTQPDEEGRPVELDVDVYLPDSPADPPRPLVEVFHGGGSDKDNAYDSNIARALAERGYVSLLYTARGHGGSGGDVTVAGPKEIRDLFDVTAWALGVGGRDRPAHPSFGIDPGRIALFGYSQGGLHVNMGQAWSADRTINPYAISFAALVPGNTPDVVFHALVDREVVKLSFGVGLLGTYFGGSRGRVSPTVNRWIATAAVDQPPLYGAGDVCNLDGHDTPTSTMKQDLAARSVGCLADRVRIPSHWAQSFDDSLFPGDMAVSMWGRSLHPDNRLYLGPGGHAAPAAFEAVERDKLTAQIAFLDHALRGRPLELPPVTYWTRDTAVRVPAGSASYPAGSWTRHEAPDWPPPGVVPVRYRLGADGRAVESGPVAEGSLRLSPTSADASNDPVVASVLGGTPLGTSGASAPPSTSSPGFVAGFSTPPFAADRELSGSPAVDVRWTPASSDSQVVLKVFARAPDGVLTLLSRGVQGLRGRSPGAVLPVRVAGSETSALIRRGHSVVATVTAGDASFYKLYPGSAGGTLEVGERSSLTLPLGRPGSSSAGAGGSCRDRTRPVSRVRAAGVGRGGLRVSGRARDSGCGRVRRVYVAVARESGSRCRFVSVRGRLGAPRSCLRSVYLRARGRTSWSLRVARRLPAGRYKVWSRAVDGAGNVERKRRSGNFRRVLARG